ncbi:hypothetical protein SAMD00019534_025450 [Acytostelium subglobosum LB1]|uniref:hypothetical protein n=1 Tax=Acytostelium subglobosum LB1 TaxID=1410327 RepID=UPI00064499D6|nr:hypothetical protein SAMD00019534_025450 [Acytostelium subglobosum LB1]GAM19370.1 hypothetical protein SAMD00019534_025450 [Acytostelium subglobosum LB1]|eukprot:XP_012757297.1 hypothetical protein SAMD00019534_025450 [Acytostelium subglobosum LB1]
MMQFIPDTTPTILADNNERAKLINEEWRNDGVRVAESTVPDGALGCYATKSYSTGDLIIKARPYCWAVVNNVTEHICDRCFKFVPERKLDRCSSCALVYYCSRQCQVDSWSDLHKHECPLFLDMNKKTKHPPPRDMIMVARMLIRTKLQRDNLSKDDKTIVGSYLVCEQLIPNTGKRSSKEYEIDVAMSRAATALLTKATIPTVDIEKSKIVLDYLSKSSRNAFQVGGGRMEKGVAMYPFISLLNHSCQPNAVQLFCGSICEVRALRPIKQGEEILICYCTQEQSHEERREVLKDYFFFDCACPKCMDVINNNRLDMYFKCNACPEGRVDVTIKDGTSRAYCLSCNKQYNNAQLKKYQDMENMAKDYLKRTKDVPFGKEMVKFIKELAPMLAYLHPGHNVYQQIIALLQPNITDGVGPDDNLAIYRQNPFFVQVLIYTIQYYIYHLGIDHPVTSDFCFTLGGYLNVIGQQDQGEEMMYNARPNLVRFNFHQN